VLIIDLVQDRFPSKHALFKEDDLEEERRLLYVACTRARRYLGLFVPTTLYNRDQDRSEPAVPNPFVRELPTDAYVEWQETYAGGLAIVDRGTGASPGTVDVEAAGPAMSIRPDGQTVGQYPSAQTPRPGQQGQGRGLEGARDARTMIQARRSGGWSPSANQDGWRDRADRAAGGFASSGIGGIGGAGRPGTTGYGPEAGDGDLAGHGYADPANPATPPDKLGYCRHKIFGRGKIVAEVPPGKYRINFPGFGLKVIMADYLVME
jgi:DNA helicase-2/ATP-dependent DNA helicase PcrA